MQRWGIKPTLLDQRREEARRAVDKTSGKGTEGDAAGGGMEGAAAASSIGSLPGGEGEQVAACKDACALHLKLKVLLFGARVPGAPRKPGQTSHRQGVGTDAASTGGEREGERVRETYTSQSAHEEICKLVEATVDSAVHVGVDMAMSESWPSASASRSSPCISSQIAAGQRGGNVSGVEVDSGGEGQGSELMEERQLRLCSAVCTDSKRLPLHLLCANHSVTAAALRTLIRAAPFVVAVPDRHGLTALHVLCCNRRVTSELLGIVLASFPSAARLPCFAGFLPLHYLCSSPSADGAMVRQLLSAYPAAVAKLKGGDASILHLISGTRIDLGARRLRGGGLEGEDVDRKRRGKRGDMLQVAVECDNKFREFEFNLASGPHVGTSWTPIPRRINASATIAASEHIMGLGRGEGDVVDRETRFRRELPCVTLSVPERAALLRGQVLEEIQAHRQGKPLEGEPKGTSEP
jgi:hypothetical protein